MAALSDKKSGLQNMFFHGVGQAATGGSFSFSLTAVAVRVLVGFNRVSIPTRIVRLLALAGVRRVSHSVSSSTNSCCELSRH